MATPFNDPIVRAQLRNTLVNLGAVHDINATLVSHQELDDGEWSAEYRYGGLKYPVIALIKKSYLESETVRLPVYKVVSTHIGPGAPWLMAAPKKDDAPPPLPVEPPKLAAVPEPEE